MKVRTRVVIEREWDGDDEHWSQPGAAEEYRRQMLEDGLLAGEINDSVGNQSATVVFQVAIGDGNWVG